ncbi:HEPN domain-containing protein [Stenotrophomonas sp.]|uniref:HEPN domain-containing protein n=1 Tax=Stenotrophomonas sp. TaxID=69392 RepID=UPI00289F298F|nr:HEPN domain-containing protein [Stenotrophomonas sp.]
MNSPLNLNILIRETRSLIRASENVESDGLAGYKAWISPKDGTARIVTDLISYQNKLISIASILPELSKRFTQKTLINFSEKKILSDASDATLPQSPHEFFKELLNIKPESITVRTPISGIRLDNGVRNHKIGAFTFGYQEDVTDGATYPEAGMYVSVTIPDICDRDLAMQRAEAAFEDVIRLIVFFSGRIDQSIAIRVGLPLLRDMSPTQVYLGSSSYHFEDDNGNPISGQLSNTIAEKVPVNIDVFSAHEHLSQIWDLHNDLLSGRTLPDLDRRMLSASLALGESCNTKDRRNSVIYTCIALEMLFSRDTNALFQKSIGSNISDLFAFVAGTDLSSRLALAKLTKKVYGMRSAIVHGGNKEITPENLEINVLLRAAVGQLLISEKFKTVKKLDKLYELMQDAHYSY